MTNKIQAQSIVFGTDGIRGCADEFPFTKQALYSLGLAFASWISVKYNKQQQTVLIGADTRISSLRITTELAQGLIQGGVNVIDVGVIPTPGLYTLLAKNNNAEVGIVISASHNPYIDNGIKVFDRHTCKISLEDEKIIINFFEQYHNQALELTVVSTQGMVQQNNNAIEQYADTVLTCFKANFWKKVKVVLDCAHGATYQVAQKIFKALGANVTVLSADPDGVNINEGCGALHPEKLAQAVFAQGADCGFAFDGDGDRVIAVNKYGQIRDGDDLLALLLDLEQYKNTLEIVGTVMTNKGFENYLIYHGRSLVRTSVGDKYIANALEQKRLLLGGEASGHIILKDYLPTGDGIFVALKVLESIIHSGNWDMKTFEKYPQVLINVPIARKQDLSQGLCAAIIADSQKKIGDGRLIVRYSGTENVLRVMTEAQKSDIASSIAHDVAHRLQEVLQSI